MEKFTIRERITADIQWLLVEMPVRLLQIKQIISFNPYLQNFNSSLK